MILINSIYILTCKVAYAIEGLHSGLTVIDLERKTKRGIALWFSNREADMNLKGLSGGLYTPLSPKDIETIHDASLTILEKTGFRFEDGLNGIKVDDEHLALEAIDAVGPGGTFITAAHTLNHMRTEFFCGNGVTDQNSRDGWIEGGSLDARTRARKIARKILAEEERPRLSAKVEQAIRQKYEIGL